MLKSFIVNHRPVKIFDPKNEEHRSLFQKYLKTQSWAHSPYQWAIDDDSMDIVHCISKKIVSYYLNDEFVAKKPRKSPQKNIFKINDLKSPKKVVK
ncbi:hypothetical protein UFOVP71_231 [uncultured Caudovirales phage]|uniref:Uncharacterized protein n=1 Tax=uncultured Caudovirales phage TaxID=2100421 RepID=A0A6J5TA71_9CAUD|nr:hypothetical protein UFOVP71_231 [uncultured Caudovirales phage]